MDDLIAQFTLDRVSKSGAKFDYEKGKWFNHQYLQMRSDEQLATEFQPILAEKIGDKAAKKYSLERVAHIIGLVKERVSFVSELWEQCNYFFVAPEEYDEKSLKKRWKEDSPQHMKELLAVLKAQKDWSADALDATVLPWIEQKGYGLGIVMNAFRICLVGAARGPHIWNITDVLGKDEVIRRVEVALKRLGD